MSQFIINFSFGNNKLPGHLEFHFKLYQNILNKYFIKKFHTNLNFQKIYS